MTTEAVEQIEKTLSSLRVLERRASTPVERVDIADIRSDLERALEKLIVLRAYQTAQDTDYDDLWEVRKNELMEYQRARDAWVRTEIFSQLLQASHATSG